MCGRACVRALPVILQRECSNKTKSAKRKLSFTNVPMKSFPFTDFAWVRQECKFADNRIGVSEQILLLFARFLCARDFHFFVYLHVYRDSNAKVLDLRQLFSQL